MGTVHAAPVTPPDATAPGYAPRHDKATRQHKSQKNVKPDDDVTVAGRSHPAVQHVVRRAREANARSLGYGGPASKSGATCARNNYQATMCYRLFLLHIMVLRYNVQHITIHHGFASQN